MENFKIKLANFIIRTKKWILTYLSKLILIYIYKLVLNIIIIL